MMEYRHSSVVHLGKRLLRNSVPSIVLVASGVALWEWAANLAEISPLILPRPSGIADNVWENLPLYLQDGAVTVREALLGFGLAMVVGMILAITMVLWSTVRHAFTPLNAALRATPIVAFAPALVLWLGFGDAPKVAIAFCIALPPVLVNTLTGLRAVDSNTLEVLRSLHASRWQIMKTLRLPHALPYVFGAARLAVALALVGAVVGEWAGSSRGLGYRIVRAQHDLETTTVWGATCVLALLGMALAGAVRIAEQPVRNRFGYNNRHSDEGEQE